MMNILIATSNPGKVKEFREMLADAEAGERSFTSLGDHDKIDPPEETGDTFRANACLKATFYAMRFKTWALADDSGLEVDALNGKPGVHSARWAELNHAGKGDADNNATLLRQIESIPDEQRTARFVCVLALSDPQGRIILTARDTFDGVLLRAPRGSNGFGYDPLFRMPDSSKTTAELSSEEKHAISHRGKALRRLKTLLAEARI
jgi:XTP/dITP diphosphohydrolase